MSAATAVAGVKKSNLDNLTLSRKEGWRDYVDAAKRSRPDDLSKGEIRRLSDAATDIHNQRRGDWHNNLGPFRTPQLTALHDDLWDIVDASTQDGNHAKTAVALDGYPGLGKTMAVETFAKEFHNREVGATGSSPRQAMNAGRCVELACGAIPA